MASRTLGWPFRFLDSFASMAAFPCKCSVANEEIDKTRERLVDQGLLDLPNLSHLKSTFVSLLQSSRTSRENSSWEFLCATKYSRYRQLGTRLLYRVIHSPGPVDNLVK